MKTMKLKQLTNRIWYYGPDQAMDRPLLGYIKGDEKSMAVDVGFSPDHAKKFYRAIGHAGLPMPDYTVITHWHWDHTFGMEKVEGKLIEHEETARILEQENVRNQNPAYARSVRRGYTFLDHEFRGKDLPQIRKPDITYRDKMEIDLGNVQVMLLHTESPHTNDSTLVWVPSEKTLFLGDAMLGDFNHGMYVDPGKMRKLREVLKTIDYRYILSGHEIPRKK